MTRREQPDLPMEIITRALHDDPAAFKKLYYRYDPVVRWAVGLCIHRWPSLAPWFEDVVQDVWLELIKDKGKRLRYFNSTSGVSFKGFVAFVAARLGWRTAKRHIEMSGSTIVREDIGDIRDKSDFVEAVERADLLICLARSLPESDRPLFVEYFVDGERIGDTAARMGLSESVAYRRLERLRKRIRVLASVLKSEFEAPPQYAFTAAGFSTPNMMMDSPPGRHHGPTRTSATLSREEKLLVTIENGAEPALVERFLIALQATFAAESSGTLAIRIQDTTEPTVGTQLRIG